MWTKERVPTQTPRLQVKLTGKMKRTEPFSFHWAQFLFKINYRINILKQILPNSIGWLDGCLDGWWVKDKINQLINEWVNK